MSCPNPEDGQAPDFDDDDLLLLAPPVLAGPGAAAAANARKDSVSWLRRGDQVNTERRSLSTSAVAASASAQAERDRAERGKRHRAADTSQLSREERLAAIDKSFADVRMPLEELRHPTHRERRVVGSYAVLPDTQLAKLSCQLVRFAEDPNETRDVHTGEYVKSTSNDPARLDHALIRPMEGDEGTRIAVYLPEDDESTATLVQASRRDWDRDPPVAGEEPSVRRAMVIATDLAAALHLYARLSGRPEAEGGDERQAGGALLVPVLAGVPRARARGQRHGRRR